jgi:hypothetical protein
MTHGRTGVIAALVAIGGAVIACTGGASGVPAEMDTQERAPASQERASSTLERASSTLERPARSQEPAPVSTQSPPGAGASGPGATPGGAFDCSGTFICTEVGDDDSDTVSLSMRNGVCTAEGQVVLESDGRLSSNGRTVGSWSLTGTGISVVVGDDVSNCVRGSLAGSGSSSSSSGSDSSAPPREPAPPSPAPTPTLDAGR